MTDDDQKDGGGDQRGRGGEGVVVKQRGLSAAFGRSAIPLVNLSLTTVFVASSSWCEHAARFWQNTSFV